MENTNVEFLTLSKEQLLTMMRNEREKGLRGGRWWEEMGKRNSEEKRKGGKGRREMMYHMCSKDQ